jgi:oligoendopeptidase F
MLVKLGFSKKKADFLASHIKVEGSRGAGHAYGSLIREDKVLLRTRIGSDGMDYKGYNIAIHEFGHNVEQVISLHDVDYYSLNRVPNTAFTEALAFIFQKRDLELLGLKDDDPQKEHMRALANFWSCYEIMGVSLVDMKVWEWMYANPDATPAQLKNAVIAIAKEIWNEFYAPVFGSKDEPILAIYSHMISYPLYLSNYPLGHVIDFQMEQYMADKHFAKEVKRMFELGSLIPQEWMRQAVGMELSIQPTLEATAKAVKAIR